jgi:uncharacterized protein YkwD
MRTPVPQLFASRVQERNGNRMFKMVRTGTCVAILFGMLAIPGSAWAQTHATPPERYLFEAANRERRAVGLHPLEWNEPLAAAARAHAQAMARHNLVSHRVPGEAALPGRAAKAGAHFSWLSENIVQSRDAAGAHSEFMKSAAHKANLLDADMNAVGIGVVERRGQLFVVEDFAQRR